MSFRKLSLAVGLILGTAGTASAAVLISPPLVPEGQNVLDCYLVNVSNTTRSVRVQVLNREGWVVREVVTSLAPGEEDVARAEAALQPRYCKFIVPGAKTDYRASVLVRQNGVGSISALTAF